MDKHSQRDTYLYIYIFIHTTHTPYIIYVCRERERNRYMYTYSTCEVESRWTSTGSAPTSRACRLLASWLAHTLHNAHELRTEHIVSVCSRLSGHTRHYWNIYTYYTYLHILYVYRCEDVNGTQCREYTRKSREKVQVERIQIHDAYVVYIHMYTCVCVRVCSCVNINVCVAVCT